MVNVYKKADIVVCTIFSLFAFTGEAQAVCVSDGFCDRPIMMGVSISNTPSLPFIYAGMAGMRVHSFCNPGIKHILSNNHVMGAVGHDLCPNTPVGLYFAGSAFSGVMNPILDVYTALRVFVDTDESEGISTLAELQQKAASMPVDARIRLLKQVQERHEARLLSVPGVRGVGIGMDEARKDTVLVVFVEKLTEKLKKTIPSELEGVRVRMIESGVIVAH